MEKRKRRVSTSRPPSATQAQDLLPISCPDCFGVLHFEREGPKGHILYRCQVNHRYGIGSLIHAKEAQLEHTLWSAVLPLQQMIFVYEDCLAELGRQNGIERRRIQRRIHEVRKQSLVIRSMIEATHAPE